MNNVLAFAPHPEHQLRNPIAVAVESAQIAVADFAIAIQLAKTSDEVIAIRRQISARVLELQAVENMALERMESLP